MKQKQSAPKAVDALTFERLKEVLVYDDKTGFFQWIDKRWSARRPNLKQAGTVTTGGYRQIQIDGVIYKAHRLAWLYITAKFPDDEIDHINGITSDNSFSNLRSATSRVNKENRHVARSDNMSGLIGAHFHKKDGWRSSIKAKGITYHLGFFKSAEDAHTAYVLAKRSLHDGCTI